MTSFFRYSEEDEHLWEPFNAELFAKHDYEISPDELDYLSYEFEEIEYEHPIEEENVRAGELHQQALKSAKIQEVKWESIRDAIFPEPDDQEPINYQPPKTLRGKFEETGLQIIVKMTSIELTPENPDLPAGDWHVSPLSPSAVTKLSLTNTTLDRGTDERAHRRHGAVLPGQREHRTEPSILPHEDFR